MDPIDRFNQHQRFAFFVLRLIWPDQARQKAAAQKAGMDYEDFDQIALAELWRCCLNFDDGNDTQFRAYVKKSIRLSLLDEMRRRGSLLKYSYDNMEHAAVIHFEKPAPSSKRGGSNVDMHALIDDGKSVENYVVTKITLEERLSVLNEKERKVILYKLASLSQREIAARGINIPLQDHYIRTAFKKLGIERKQYQRQM